MRYPLRQGTSVPLVLEYADAQGEHSTRTVMPIALVADEVRQSSSSTYLQARCNTARAVRTFRCDRIISLSDPDTGEIRSAQEWLAELQLVDAEPFQWADETVGEAALLTARDDAAAHDIPWRRISRQAELAHPAEAPAHHFPWRAITIALVIGYAVGRLRLAHIVLRYSEIHHGLLL